MDVMYGNWKQDTSKNVNVAGFLTTVGYPKDAVDHWNTSEQSVEIKPEGGKTRVTITSAGRPSSSFAFALNEPFTMTTPDGLELSGTVTGEGAGVFKEQYKNESLGIEFTAIREVKGKVMKIVTSAKGDSMTHVLNKV